MRRIKNTNILQASVKQFNLSLFDGRRTGFIKPLDKLATLKKERKKRIKYGLADVKVVEYVSEIIANYQDILNADPVKIKKLIKRFDAIIPSTTITKPFHEAVVSAMRYDDLRQVEFPEILRKLNIKTCVYCHSQSTLIVDKPKSGKWRALLQLDHKYPKSAYPFLCTSFYNLYPICGNCNLSKSSKSTSFELYVNNDDLDLLQFGLKGKSVLKYWKTKDGGDLEVTIKPIKIGKTTLEQYGKMFHIKEIYDLQKDIAEELVQKLDVYSKTYKGTLVQSFKQLFPDASMINRLLIGNYDDPTKMLNRPMAKFMQEVARSIKLIPEVDDDPDSWSFLQKKS